MGKELDANLTVLYDKAYALGGLASGEHGIGLSKQKYHAESIKAGNNCIDEACESSF